MISRVPVNVKHKWRIVDFQQAAGILGVATNGQHGAHLANAIVLGGSQFERLTQGETLGGSSGQAAASISVSDAANRRSTVPKCSSSLRARPAPIPGVWTAQATAVCGSGRSPRPGQALRFACKTSLRLGRTKTQGNESRSLPSRTRVTGAVKESHPPRRSPSAWRLLEKLFRSLAPSARIKC